MGRNKTPTKIHVLKGTDRADRMNRNEPDFNPGIPSPPEWLDAVALVEWGRFTNLCYANGTLEELDMAMVAAYCVAFSRWGKAETDLKKTGLLAKTPNGHIQQSPLVGIANQAMEKMMKAAGKMGGSAVDRTGATARNPKKPESDFVKYKKKQR